MKNKAKQQNKKKKEIQRYSSENDSSIEDQLNDESENEYDEEDMNSEEKNFIADDDEVEFEIEQAKKRQKKEKKKKKLEKVKSENIKKNQNIKQDLGDESDLEEDDYELINENNQKQKKLKKLNDIYDVTSQNSQQIFKNQGQIKNSYQNDEIVIRGEIKNENQHGKGLFNQGQKKREDSTADDDERQTSLQQKQLQTLKDKFVVEDIDDLFCTQYDQEILNTDIPERLQLKLQGRFKPQQEELVNEAQWIFDNIIENLPASKENLSQRDLRDYQTLIDFYKSYYSRELEQIAQNDGKKLPVQKNTFLQLARQNKYDQFAKKFLLSPQNFVENIQEDKLIHRPPCPAQKIKDIARDYILQSNLDQSLSENQKYLTYISEVGKYAAIELWCQPELRKTVKKYVKENGTLITQPTEKGMKELDVLHSSYRVKRVNKRLIDIDQSDIFLDIIQNESFGFITCEIQVEKINEFYDNLFEKYETLQIINEHEKKWQIARNEVKKIFCSDSNPMNKNKKTFLQIVIDEIKEELKEDSENYILKQCKDKYQSLVQMGYFKIRDDEKIQKKPQNKLINLNDDDCIIQRERLNVMGAILHPIDNRNFMTTVAIVDHYGELVAHKDFTNLIPPSYRVRKQDGNQQEQHKPGEIDEKISHEKSKRQLQQLLRQHQVDLIVVSADCLDARKLRKCLSEFASFENYQENDHTLDDQQIEENENIEKKEALVIWGRPEVPKLFASSHQSQKLFKNMPFVLKKAICLARFEQDPMNEIFNLWSPIQSENESLNLNLHPLQKLINKARLMDCLEEVNIKAVNSIGIDINILIDHEHQHNQIQFLSGLGPRKAQKFIQKLRQRGKPLYTRMDIWESKLIEKSCFMSCVNFLKIRIPLEKRTSEPITINILDQTRINPREYELMQRIAVYCIYGNEEFQNIDELKKVQAVNELINNPEKLREIQNSEFKDQMNQNNFPLTDKRQNETKIDYNFHIDKIIKEYIYPFRDPRDDKNFIRTFDDQKFPSNELFYSLIDETDKTFKKGMIVSANIVKIFQSNGNMPARILCRLENGLDANINQNDADFFGSVNIGSIVQGRVDQIKYGQTANDENFSVNLKCKQNDLRRHDQYAANLENIPEEDLINLNFKVQEEQAQIQKKLQIQKRKIQHTRFQNISSTTAMHQLKKEDNGEFYFRPSSKGVDNITLTWKFYENNIVHIDIKESDKAIGANIGSKLWINQESFDNLQEIVERYIIQCNRLVREVTQHQKFYKCNSLEELSLVVMKEKQENDSCIPYRFTILDEYPQYIILAYAPKKDVVREFIKVKPKGYFFHHQYQYPFQNMINWFKKSFKTREYQYYLRKTQSPQRVVQQIYQSKLKQNDLIKSNNEINGMEIDEQKNQDKQGQYENKIKRENNQKQFNNKESEMNGWGDQSPKKNEGKGGWGDENQDQDRIKDEREKDGGGWGSTNNNNNQEQNYQSPQRSERNFRGGGRGRGQQNGGGRNCFKCGEEGHISKDCTKQNNNFNGSKQKGMNKGGGGGGGRTNKCFNCDQEGHMSRDCPEPRKERQQKCYNCQQDGHMSRNCPEPKQERGPRNGNDDYPPYKRQRNDNEGSTRQNNNDQSGWNEGSKKDWNNNQNTNEENGWGNEQQNNVQKGGGWGDNSQDANVKSQPSDKKEDAWGTNINQSSQNQGWN